MLTYSITNQSYKINKDKQKIELLKIQFKKKSNLKIINKYKHYIINKSSFKYKKSREQYAICKTKKKWFIKDKTIIPKIFEYLYLLSNLSTNQYIINIKKLEYFKI